jgi:hypothetical protein
LGQGTKIGGTGGEREDGGQQRRRPCR